MITLLAPLAYIALLLGSLATFSHFYRRRKQRQVEQLKPWFGPNIARDVYMSLMHMDPQPSATTLQAALMRRAAEDVERLISLQRSRPALHMLLQRGLVGDSVWTQFTAAEKELEAEAMDVVAEANAYKENWGSYIFQSAQTIKDNEGIRQRAAKVSQHAVQEGELWVDAGETKPPSSIENKA